VSLVVVGVCNAHFEECWLLLFWLF
jgi:hypothetical protein